MTQTDCQHAQEEIERLLNDPETPMAPDRVWALAEAIAAAGCDSCDQLRQRGSPLCRTA